MQPPWNLPCPAKGCFQFVQKDDHASQYRVDIPTIQGSCHPFEPHIVSSTQVRQTQHPFSGYLHGHNEVFEHQIYKELSAHSLF
nr:hypothetical protein Iba_chr15fCG6710 [Ipomoea batatas]